MEEHQQKEKKKYLVPPECVNSSVETPTRALLCYNAAEPIKYKMRNLCQMRRKCRQCCAIAFDDCLLFATQFTKMKPKTLQCFQSNNKSLPHKKNIKTKICESRGQAMSQQQYIRAMLIRSLNSLLANKHKNIIICSSNELHWMSSNFLQISYDGETSARHIWAFIRPQGRTLTWSGPIFRKVIGYVFFH